jgi:hypothetical protein
MMSGFVAATANQMAPRGTKMAVACFFAAYILKIKKC